VTDTQITEPQNPEAEPARGLTRRQIAIGAAWAAPVLALAVASPAAAASGGNPSANVGGTMTASSDGPNRTVSYQNGFISYDSQGQPVTSGNLTLSFDWTTAALVPSYVLEDFQAQGWVVQNAYTSGGTTFSFTHSPVADGDTVTIPGVTWTGVVEDVAPNVTATLISDNPDVFGSTVGV
jgi:hypothetical protein